MTSISVKRVVELIIIISIIFHLKNHCCGCCCEDWRTIYTTTIMKKGNAKCESNCIVFKLSWIFSVFSFLLQMMMRMTKGACRTGPPTTLQTYGNIMTKKSFTCPVPSFHQLLREVFYILDFLNLFYLCWFLFQNLRKSKKTLPQFSLINNYNMDALCDLST